MKTNRVFGKTFKIVAVLLSLVLLGTAVVLAAWTPEDFNTFEGTGFAPEPAAGQLDSDAWRVTGMSDGDGTFGGTHDTGDFARGTNAGTTPMGGVWAFEVGTDNYALGIKPGGSDFTPGEVTLRVQNDTGSVIEQIYVQYEILVYNNQPRTNSFNFAYSTDDTTYTPVPELDFASPADADASPEWVSYGISSTTISGLNIGIGDYFYLQWQGDDVVGSPTGARDAFALDNVEVRVDGPTAVTFTSLNALSPALGISAALVLTGAVVVLRKRK